MARLFIEAPGKSAAMRHLSHRYTKLLELHDRYRTSVATAARLPLVVAALDVVRDRIARQSDAEALRRAA